MVYAITTFVASREARSVSSRTLVVLLLCGFWSSESALRLKATNPAIICDVDDALFAADKGDKLGSVHCFAIKVIILLAERIWGDISIQHVHRGGHDFPLVDPKYRNGVVKHNFHEEGNGSLSCSICSECRHECF